MKMTSLSRLMGSAVAGLPVVTTLTGLTLSQTLSAADAQISFNRDVRPILADNCFHCHGPDPATRKAGLRLDTEAGLFEKPTDEKRKNDPPAVIRGKAEESELFKRLITKDKDDVMPPPDSHKELKPAEIALLKRWIESGANWQPHWALIPPSKAEVPAVKNGNWAKGPIDRFVLAKLESKGLAPAPEANPRELFRRLHLDVTGLPPHPSDVDAFANEYANGADEAVARWVDRLMQSPSWGEHRARYWLDAARYSDTHGLHFDNYREMYPYRDWVIRAFNANKSFAEFTVEQIAGDLLPQPREDQLIATGFQRCGLTTNEGGTIAEENLATYAAERVQTMGWVFLGLTLNCCQCHDHKFDPFTMRDFYSMAAFFRNTKQGAFDGNNREGNGPVIVLPSPKDRERWDALPGIIKTTTTQRDERRKAAEGDFKAWLAKVDVPTLEGELPSKDLAVHALLNEGAGNDIKLAGCAAGNVHSEKDLEWEAGGKYGAALSVKKGGTVNLGNVAEFESNKAFSYGAWVKTAKAEGSGAVLSRMNSAEGNRGYDLFVQGKTLAVHIANTFPDNGLKVTAANVLKAGVYQHVFMTYNGSGKGSGVKLFVDGKEVKVKVEKDTLKAGATIASGVPFYVGQRSSGAVLEGASVQDVRVYSRKLAEKEVADLAMFPALQKALEGGDKRSPQQRGSLQDYFLTHHDASYQELDQKLASAQSEKDAIKARSAVTHVQEENMDKMPMANILARGAYNKPGEEVAAMPPAVLHPLPEGAPKNRMGLAKWLVADNNPLTVRVSVNRFWQEVFGQGIVKSVEDFGVMGAEPSNQALLDWVSADFRENGWNVQRLFKQILTSATYRQAAVLTPEKLEKDRDNALLSRGPRFRMDAEMLRDYALVSSGLMSSKMYGPGTRPYQPEGIWDVVGLPGADTRNYVQDKGENLYRRTVYNFHKRMAPSPNMETFNLTSREFSCVRRERTNTPLQALVTLNDPQFVEAARQLAQTALERAGEDQAKALDFISRRVLGRVLSEKERIVLQDTCKTFITYYQEKPEDAASLIKVGDSIASTKVAPPLLAAWTMVCNEVLNLDETLNK
ncbi:MAG: DUF1553 domain-containing protein [Verrucomicrobiota bacterium]